MHESSRGIPIAAVRLSLLQCAVLGLGLRFLRPPAARARLHRLLRGPGTARRRPSPDVNESDGINRQRTVQNWRRSAMSFTSMAYAMSSSLRHAQEVRVQQGFRAPEDFHRYRAGPIRSNWPPSAPSTPIQEKARSPRRSAWSCLPFSPPTRLPRASGRAARSTPLATA